METLKTNESFPYRKFFLSDYSIIIFITVVKLFIHLVTNVAGGYGYFRDELYYIACSDHMAWGYVDQPPFSIFVLWISRLVFGDSLFAIRLLPAISGAVVVAVAGLMTRELGGKRFAQILASSCVIVAPMLLGINSNFSMNSFDLLFWSLAFYVIILLQKKDSQKYWIFLGVLLGLGLLNKISVLWFGAGLAGGMLLTPYRKLLLTRKVWAAAAIALILFLPHLVWQVMHGFPTLEFMKNALSNKYVTVTPLEMVIQQALNMNPAIFPIWFAGLVYLLVSKSMRRFQILPLIYLIVFLILTLNRNSKSEYLGPMFPMLFAAGACAFEKFILRFNGRWIKRVVLSYVIISGIVLAPFGIPILPVETFISYSRMLGITPSTSEKKQLSKLPQHYADMFGWEKLTAVAADVYKRLSPEERAKCVIFCNNYGEAGAIDFFGGAYNLPKTISGHNNYWLWGCQNASGELVIRLGGSKEAMLESYKEVEQAGFFQDEYCMPYENKMPIYLCKGRRTPLKDDWTKFKHFE
jgi:hypothetical protein